jgi:hypothetical protein
MLVIQIYEYLIRYMKTIEISFQNMELYGPMNM